MTCSRLGQPMREILAKFAEGFAADKCLSLLLCAVPSVVHLEVCTLSMHKVHTFVNVLIMRNLAS